MTVLDFQARDTAIQRVDALAAELGLTSGQLWIKRDDRTGLNSGGNKARKLEYLVGDATDRGCDVLVTTGAAQSNHVSATAAAARASGMDCVAVLSTLGAQHQAEGNLVLDDLFDVKVVWCHPDERRSQLAATTAELTEQGRRPYAIPIGGTNALGASGYVIAADEITAVVPDCVTVCAVGTGGTQAGLTVGMGDHNRVLGFDVAAIPDLDDTVPQVIDDCAELLGRPTPVGTWSVDRRQAQEPYGKPTAATHEAIRLTARTTGLILDPVYTGRAMAGLIERARDSDLPDAPIVFVHSGGMPALFTHSYRHWFAVPTELSTGN
jgi:L-cysteate sulfo-lyase